jgi:pyrimidine-specific ribonucleoside hydrolase
MNVFVKVLFFVSLGFMSLQAKAINVIYDTDMAIDDWIALLYLEKHPEVNLTAVTVSCSGESRCQPGVNNVISLLDLSQKKSSIAVASGDAYPLDGYFVFPEPWRVDSDTLSGVAVNKPSYAGSQAHAVEVLHQTFLTSKEPITIIAVGPLTNIAQWLQKYPNDTKKLERLVIMGGALDTKGNIEVPMFTPNHPNQRAEWNLFIDPLATKIVLESNLPIELVGLDVTNTVRVTSSYVAEFKTKVNNPVAQFIDNVYDKNDWFIESNEYYFWDLLAAIIVTNPELCQAEKTALTVGIQYTNTPTHLKTSNINMPTKRWDGKPRNHIVAQTAGSITRKSIGNKVDVCMKTQPKVALGLFDDLMTLNKNIIKSENIYSDENY